MVIKATFWARAASSVTFINTTVYLQQTDIYIYLHVHDIYVLYCFL